MHTKKQEDNYWSQCMKVITEYQDNILLLGLLGHLFYCKRCSRNEEIKLLEIVKECVKDVERDNKYVTIAFPIFTNKEFKNGDMSKEYYKVNYVSHKKFLSRQPKSIIDRHEDLYIRIY